MAAAAVETGVDRIEVTLDSDQPFDQIAAISREVSAAGVGSVTQADQVDRAVEAGARFVISPAVVAEVVEACRRWDVPCIAGAASPTEVLAALRLGATAVKVFPALQLGGPGYLRAISSPLGDPPLIPTGGVGLETARAYLDAGAVALGVGGALFPEAALADGDHQAIRRLSQAWVEAVR